MAAAQRLSSLACKTGSFSKSLDGIVAPSGCKLISAAAGDDSRAAPSRKQRWWRPDPVTGTWIPEDHEGKIDTVELREERLRSVPTASLEDRAWWNSLEDLPDRDTPTSSQSE